MLTPVIERTNERKEVPSRNLQKKKRITTVPQFESTKKLMKQNKKIINLVSNK